MTDDLGRISSPVANGATGDSVSALSVGSNGGTKAIDASDVEARSTVTFLIAEINRLAEEISVRSSGAKAIDASDVLLDVEKRLLVLAGIFARVGGPSLDTTTRQPQQTRLGHL
jgi:hypothetical protein